MRGGKTIVGVTAVTVGVLLAAGCQLIAGVKDTLPYPADGGIGGAGGSAGATSGTGGASSCAPGSKIGCYSGPDGTKGVGICQEGKQTCRMDGSGYDACVGEVKPTAESCAAAEDENCDGHDCVQWAELFGDGADQQATSIAIDSKGNVYVAGIFYGAIHLGPTTLVTAGESDVFLLKLDPTGKPIWSKQFGDGQAQDSATIALDSSDGVYLGGRSATKLSLGGAEVTAGLFVAKFSSDGMHLWSKGLTTEAGCVGSDSNLSGLATTPQHDVVVCGYYCGTIDFGDGAVPSQGNRDGFVAKLKGDDGSVNAADETWGRVLGAAAAQEVNGVAVDPAGNILIAGTFSGSITFAPGDFISSSGGSDAFIAKFTTAGLPSWHDKFGDGSEQSMLAISVDSNGGPVVTGTFAGTVDFGNGAPVSGTSFIAKYDASGAYVWSKTAATTGAATSVATDDIGGVFVAGTFLGSIDLGGGPLQASGPGAETFVAKIASSGVLVWNKRFGDTQNFVGTGAALAVTMAREPILAGRVQGPIDFGTGVLQPAGGIDIFVAKLSP